MASGQGFETDADLTDLQTNFDKQQAKITELREIIRQTEAVNDMKQASAKERLQNIAHRLTHFKTKATSSRLSRASSGQPLEPVALANPTERRSEAQLTKEGGERPMVRGRSESSGIEKCTLLREQIEQNRLKMAARESSKREIEERVSEIKLKLETSRRQTMERAVEMERVGLTDSADERFSYSSHDVSGILHTAINWSTDTASDAPVDTSASVGVQLGRSVYSSTASPPIKPSYPLPQSDAMDASKPLPKRDVSIVEPGLLIKADITEEQLEVLATLASYFNGHSSIDFIGALRQLQVESKPDTVGKPSLSETGTDRTQESTSSQDECQSYDIISVPEVEGHQLSTVAASEALERVIAATSELSSSYEQIASLEGLVASQGAEMQRMDEEIDRLRQALEEKTIEANVMAANVSVLQEKLKTTGPKPLFPKSSDSEESEAEMVKLKQQLDESNKSMIKCKLKIKQLQKQVDTFRKTSNVHAEVVRLTEEVNLLMQQLQAATGERQSVAAGTIRPGDENEPANMASGELRKRIETLELTCQHQVTAMQLLEEQKNDLQEDLSRAREEIHVLKVRPHGVECGETGRIVSQMLTIELEEQLEQCLADKTELSRDQQAWQTERQELTATVQRYQEENQELRKRLLNDQKLSIEKLSSAESIEILENLTQHEKQEMEKSEKRTAIEQGSGEVAIAPGVPEAKEDLNESLLKLMEESRELMEKVELFTDERREVLEKLDAISIENQAYVCELDKLREMNQHLSNYSIDLAKAKSELEEKLRQFSAEKECIRQELETVRSGKPVEQPDSVDATSYQQQQQPQQIHPRSSTPAAQSFNKEDYQRLVESVENEVASYTKQKDKHKKLQVSKKLTACTKHLLTMDKQLLHEYERLVNEHTLAAEQSPTIAIDSAPIDHERSSEEIETELAEVSRRALEKEQQVAELQEQLTLALSESMVTVAEKDSDDELELLQLELNSKNEEIQELRRDIAALVDAKASEMYRAQTCLAEAQTEVHNLQTAVTEWQRKCSQLEAVHDPQAFEQLQQELRHQQDTVRTLNDQIVELYRTIEDRDSELVECQELIEQLRDQKQSQRNQLERIEHERNQLTGAVGELRIKLDNSLALHESLQREKVILGQKNEELLEKLKKFAANLKKKNAQCSELEKQVQCNDETIQHLTKTVKQLEEELRETAPKGANEADADVEQERVELAQKLHHLNNELHRLLEQKYQLEADLQTMREELRTVREQLAVADAEIVRGSEKLQATEQELTEVRWTVEAHEQELSVRQAKLDKCKAIIKEKIKETQRLQESERRTAYLEDELRMTQCKLEEFHKQTLLLGRLKNEKEELNAALREEQEHRRKLEEELALLRQQVGHSEERERQTEANLSKLSDWLRRYEAGWRSAAGESANDHDHDQVKAAMERFIVNFASDAHAPDVDLMGLPSILAESNQHITLLLQSNTQETSELAGRLHEQQLLTGTLESELELLRQELHVVSGRHAFSEQIAKEKNEAFERVTQELHEARDQLSQLRQVELKQIEAELEKVQTELTQVQAELDKVRIELEQSKNDQHTVSAECAELRSRNAQQTDLLSALEDAKVAFEEKSSNQLNSLTADRNMLQAELAAVISEKEALLVECNQSERTRCAFEDQLADLTGKLAASEQQLGALQQQYDDRQLATVERNEALTLECNRYRADCERLARELEDMSQQKVLLQTMIDEKEIALGELRASLDELRVRHNEAIMSATDKDHFKSEYEALDQELKSLKQVQEQLDQSSTQMETSLRRQCEELRQECEELKRQALLKSETQTQLRVAADSCNMWDDQSLDAGWGDTDTAQQDEVLRQKDEHIQQLMVEKELMQGEINELKVRSGKLVRKLKECKAKADNLQAGLASSSEEGGPERIAELQREQSELMAKYDTLRESFERMQELNRSQAAQLGMLEQTISERKAIANQPMELAERLSQLCGSLEQLQAKLAELRPEELSPAAPITTTLDSFVQRCRAVLDCVAAQRGGAELKELDHRQPRQKTEEPISGEEDDGSRDVAYELKQRVTELEYSHGQLEQEKSKLEKELDELNQRIMQDWRFEDQLNRVTLELDAKNVELQMVRSTLEQLQASTGVGEGISKRESDLLDEIDELKDQIKLLEQELVAAGTQIGAAASNELVAKSEQVILPPISSPMEDPQVRAVLEQQETEIVTLQQQLAIRSAEYARLASQIDPARLAVTINRPSETSSDTQQQQQQQQAGDRVPRAELELALYMVYQRDMRCEELELELQNLLQERDALQLRLSNAIRVHEEFKVRLAEGPMTSASSSSVVVAEAGLSGESSLEAGASWSEREISFDEAASRPGSATDAQDLSTKLSELQSIGYTKEKRRQEEREDRNRQLAQIQRDLANMPLEAAAKIAGTEVADTEAASQQSASSVLINWILGKK
uniref:Putative myosin class ii heavy chain n=1 Tax=Anopheles triannulatus TaxID=58253 RepID=A0A2M4A0K6_9DIPT